MFSFSRYENGDYDLEDFRDTRDDGVQPGEKPNPLEGRHNEDPDGYLEALAGAAVRS